jgi:hypothetical protein
MVMRVEIEKIGTYVSLGRLFVRTLLGNSSWELFLRTLLEDSS